MQIKKAKNPLIILTPQKMSEPEKTAKVITKFKHKKPIVLFLGEKSIKSAIQILKNKKIPVYTQAI